MTVTETSLCRCSYIFHVFPLQTKISEPTDFVHYFQNLYVRGLFLRWSTVLCGEIWCCVVVSGDFILPTCFEIELSGMQQVKIFLNWILLPIFIGRGCKDICTLFGWGPGNDSSCIWTYFFHMKIWIEPVSERSCFLEIANTCTHPSLLWQTIIK
jgi:hypothetical protein